MTPEEYLRLERLDPWKNEYFDGKMSEMAHPNITHAGIVGNLIYVLHEQLERPCQVYSSRLRLRTPSGLYTYPDLMAICGQPQCDHRQDGDDSDTVLNPVMIIEVLYDSTEAYDRGRKFEQYRTLPSLREYLLVAQDAPHVDLYTLGADGRWVLSESKGLDATVRLTSIDCEFPLSEIYRKIDFAS